MAPATQRIVLACTVLGAFIIAVIIFTKQSGYTLRVDQSNYLDRSEKVKNEHGNHRVLDDSFILREVSSKKVVIQDASTADLVFMGNSEITLLPNMTFQDADIAFAKYVNTLHFICRKSMRLGKRSDGGWDMCLVPPFLPDSPCLIYSFGINNDFSFDDAAAETFNCTIRAFDPSMQVEDHRRGSNIWFYKIGLDGKNYVNPRGWNMMTFSSILEKFGESNKIIDYLKFDIEQSEWPSIDSMIATGALSRVRQVAIEIHPPGMMRWTLEKYHTAFQRLKQLEEAGMRRWYIAMNSYDIRRTANGLRTCCYEIVYINTNFLPSWQMN